MRPRDWTPAFAGTAPTKLIRFGAIAVLLALALPAAAAPPVETPTFAAFVATGKMPPVAERLPAEPWVVEVEPDQGSAPRSGGKLGTLLASAKEARQITVFGYARLVSYNERLELVPDILAGFDVREGRIFTLRLRKGHRWSTGVPFTSEDFRYFWEDVANNPKLSPGGLPVELTVDGQPPKVEIVDETTVRYTWPKPNPAFLPALAAPNPTYIFRPSHYLRQFHAKYVKEAELAQRVQAAKQRSWQSLHNKMDAGYKNDNPEFPVLEPWVLTTPLPAERLVFARNPYYHRVDTQGQQLPYIDELVVDIASGDLIAAKAGMGEAELQARYLRFDNIPFLKQNAAAQGFDVRLWKTGKGAHLALYPNLNVEDPVWRTLFRDVRFRRALSMGVWREEINKALFYGLAIGGNNSLLPESPLYEKELRQRWAQYDLAAANALLDEIGLKRDRGGVVGGGLRRLPDGRPMEIIVETAGENTEETDVLQLIHDSWIKLGIKIYTKPMQREVFRNRIFAGSTQMSIWAGLDNGLATADMSPADFAPTSQQQLQWPKWGQFYETRGKAGEAPDLPAAVELKTLYESWRVAADRDERSRIWKRVLEVSADQVFSIGLIGGVLQPIIVSNRLKGVPEKAIYNWDPGAFFGIYKPDSFWLTAEKQG